MAKRWRRCTAKLRLQGEIFKAAPDDTLSHRIITPQFKEIREDGIKMISFWAKCARGAIARFMAENRLTNPDDLKDFRSDGYAFQPGASPPYKRGRESS